jgi:hypothetical protein
VGTPSNSPVTRMDSGAAKRSQSVHDRAVSVLNRSRPAWHALA